MFKPRRVRGDDARANSDSQPLVLKFNNGKILGQRLRQLKEVCCTVRNGCLNSKGKENWLYIADMTAEWEDGSARWGLMAIRDAASHSRDMIPRT